MSVRHFASRDKQPRVLAVRAENSAWSVLGAAAISTVGFASAAAAASAPSVQSLISQDFVVVGAVPSQAGPGLFLQKKDKLFFCVVAETPTSETVDSRYCKPVR